MARRLVHSGWLGVCRQLRGPTGPLDGQCEHEGRLQIDCPSTPVGAADYAAVRRYSVANDAENPKIEINFKGKSRTPDPTIDLNITGGRDSQQLDMDVNVDVDAPTPAPNE